ncbi:MAG: PhoPQ-activated pathogenicity-like protein PqaA type [Bacteroidaceae bacterium]|nr:PhoPQ-activated pathogenicity-like protein PqaA type [Bacteroidaceae bacterium]
MKPYLTLFALLLINLSIWSSSDQALRSYIENGDTSYRWSVIDSTRESDILAYRLQLVSQTWQGIPWNHELVILVPQKVRHHEALLHLTGGSEDEKNGQIKYHGWDDGTIRAMGQIAHNCQAVTAILWQVPRQPLFDGKKEDVLVSYTFHQYQQTNDETWPLLFPMAKSALRAMDAITQFTTSRRVRKEVNRFVVNGVSKRGWTTWMAAATGDKRIVAIAPMVIDILNMPVNVAYQKHMYGQYSPEIQDYVNLGLTETVANPDGKALVEMVDPYSYRQLFTMPKMIFMGSNDPFWTADAVKNYINDIPGHILLNYTPNAGHDLRGGQEARNALEAFFYQTIHKHRYPSCKHSAHLLGNEAQVNLETRNGRLVKIELWEAESPTKDFRKTEFIAKEFPVPSQRTFDIPVSLPATGYKAFFVRLYYKHPTEQEPYTISTRMYTASDTELYNDAYRP